MSLPVYTVLADFDRDWTFGHVLADTTDRVIDASWQNGMTDSYQDFAPPATATVTIKNVDGALWPDDSTSIYHDIFTPGLMIRINATHEGTTRTMYTGRIKAAQFSAHQYQGRPVLRLELEDFSELMRAREFSPDLLTDVRIDQALTHTFERGLILPPYPASWAIMDVSLMDDCMFWDASQFIDFEQAVTTVPYAGDAFADGDKEVSLLTHVENLVHSEMRGGARFWWDTRESKWKFHNRHHDLLNTDDTLYTFLGEQLSNADPRYADDLYNFATITYSKRSEGIANSVLWSSAKPIRVKAGERKKVTARYTNPDEKSVRVAALEVTAPVSGTDFVVNSEEDGGGENVTSYCGVTITERATAAELTLYNGCLGDAYFITAQVRGTPLYRQDNQAYTYGDPDSVAAYGYRMTSINVPIIEDEDTARGFAKVTVERAKNALMRYASIETTLGSLTDNPFVEQVISRTIGDRVGVKDDKWSKHDEEYTVVGERHSIQQLKHVAQFILRPRRRITGFIMDDPILGVMDSSVFAF